MRRTITRTRKIATPAGLVMAVGLLAACGTAAPATSPGGSAAGSAPASGAPAASGAAASAGSSGSPSPSASAGSGGQLGMIFEVNNAGWQKLLGTPAKPGMVVVMVVPNQPAAKAGVVEGDLVTSFNGAPAPNANAANVAIRKLKVGDKVQLDVTRKSGAAKVDLTVEPSSDTSLPQLLGDNLKKNSNDARAYFLRGAYGDSDAKAAVDDYTKAISLNGDFVSAYVERGTLLQASNADQSMKDFDKAASLDPNYEPLYVNRSVLYSSQKNYDKALEDDKKAVQLDPTDPAAYANLGIGFVNKGDPAQALTAENQALDKDPLYGPALLYRGLLQRDAAKSDLEKASQLIKDPNQRAIAQSALQKLS